MAINPDYLRCKEERNNKSFFKVLQSLDVSSENLRALPYDFVRSFSDKELSRKMMIKAKWGSSWEIAISKNPRFYYMEKSGWGKFVRDNALGNREFITFVHKGKMSFTVNIFKQDGKEMMQPPHSADPEATSRIKTEQEEDDMKEEVVVVSSELSSRGVTTAAAESNGGGTSQRKPNLGKKIADERSQNSSMRAEKDSASASSSSLAEFTIFIKKSYINFLAIPRSFAKDHMPKEKQKVKIHHLDGKRAWKVTYLTRKIGGDVFSGGWGHLVREYPIAVGDSCKFTLTKPDELLLVVSKPEEETE